MTVYRDATYSAETQAVLHSLLEAIRAAGFHRDYLDALADVIGRWDANDATEIVGD